LVLVHSKVVVLSLCLTALAACAGRAHGSHGKAGSGNDSDVDGGSAAGDGDAHDGADAALPDYDLPFSDALLLWLDGSAESTMYESGGIESWLDRSTRHHILTQSSAAQRPKIIRDAVAGRSVLRFDGKDDYFELVNDGSFDTDDLSVMVLISPRWATPPGGNPCPFAIRSTNATTRISLHLDGKLADMHSFNDDGISYAKYAFAEQKYYLLEFVWSKGMESHYVNGKFIDAGAHALSTKELLRPIVIGAAEATIEHWPGDVAELLVFGKALTDAQRKQLEHYVELKWSIDTSP
jgi:hypothetical protein